MLLISLLSLIITNCDTSVVKQNQYLWIEDYRSSNSIACRIPVPDGFEREKAADGSFGEWLRNLPLKNGRPNVLLYDGSPKWNQDAHYAVINIDTGKKDLQQCADALIRLRAEYLYSHKQYSKIHFNFTSGDTMAFEDWSRGIRPLVAGPIVSFMKTKSPDSSYTSFREYLDKVFTYAGTKSLHNELTHVNLSDMQVGDIFIQSGNMGHAVIVIDMASDTQTGEKLFMLAQSYMPAQDIQILKNPISNDNPWYWLDFGETLITPEWRFTSNDLYRF